MKLPQFPEFKKKFCLVLGGGGTKGCYEIGVWRALRELHIPIEAVVGTSIGALNGIWVAQDDFDAANEVWDRITVGDILKVRPGFEPPPEMPNSLVNTLSLLGKVALREGGLDNEPLRKLVLSQLKPEKLRESRIDLGIVAFNSSRLASTEVFLNEITTEELVDYVMASSTFPGFKQTKIKGEDFLDGGVWNNLPYETARKRGYRRIIAVDVGGVGHYLPINIQGTETIYIKNSLDLGHEMDFRPEFIQKFKLLGYLDTMRIFGKFLGTRFFLERDRGFFHHWNRILQGEEFLSEISYLLPSGVTGSPLDKIRKILPAASRYSRNPALILLESAAEALGVDHLQVYTPRKLTEVTVLLYWDLMERIGTLNLDPYRKFSTALLEEWKKPLLSRTVEEQSPLELDLILTRLEFPQKHPRIYGAVTQLFPFLAPAKVFFHLVSWSQRHRPLLAGPGPHLSLADLKHLG